MTGQCKLMIEGGESEFYSLKYADCFREREREKYTKIFDSRGGKKLQEYVQVLTISRLFNNF